MVRLIRLHQHLSRQLARALPARLTCVMQLKHPLRRAKVRQPQREVRAHHAHQRHAMNIVPLGDHLRAHQQVDLARMQPAQQPLHIAARHAPCRDPCARSAPRETAPAAAPRPAATPRRDSTSARSGTSDKPSAPSADSRNSGTPAAAPRAPRHSSCARRRACDTSARSRSSRTRASRRSSCTSPQSCSRAGSAG